MTAKNAARPRPSKNADGQDKKPQPTMSHSIDIQPGEKPEAPPTPGAQLPGHVNPMTHPNHPTMQSNITAGHPLPGTPPAGPTGAPTDQRQVRENIQFKDMPPVGQNQAMQQQGIDPYAMFEMGQQKINQAVQQGPSAGPVPNAMTGPGIPSDQGIESFPDDMAHLTTLMGQGYAPGASAQEHGTAMNAHALARAKIMDAMHAAQTGAGAPQGPPPPSGPVLPQTPSPPQFGPPGPSAFGPPPGPPGAMAPPIPPPQAAGAPGGIPPELIAALLKKKPLGAVR